MKADLSEAAELFDLEQFAAHFRARPTALKVASALICLQALWIAYATIANVIRIQQGGATAGGGLPVLASLLFLPAAASLFALGMYVVIGRRFAWIYSLGVEGVIALISAIATGLGSGAQIARMVAQIRGAWPAVTIILLLLEPSRAVFTRPPPS